MFMRLCRHRALLLLLPLSVIVSFGKTDPDSVPAHARAEASFCAQRATKLRGCVSTGHDVYSSIRKIRPRRRSRSRIAECPLESRAGIEACRILCAMSRRAGREDCGNPRKVHGRLRVPPAGVDAREVMYAGRT